MIEEECGCFERGFLDKQILIYNKRVFYKNLLIWIIFFYLFSSLMFMFFSTSYYFLSIFYRVWVDKSVLHKFSVDFVKPSSKYVGTLYVWKTLSF